METNTRERKGDEKADYRPVVGIAIVSLLVCGLFFPLLVTGIAQAVFPYQANGEIVYYHGQPIGSELRAQNFTLPIFFHPRNDSASGVDPAITVQDALSQIPRISGATGIPVSSLQAIVDQNVDPQGRYVELQYVNVLSLNVQLVESYPAAYAAYA